jgi:hypothetical protein
MIKFLKNIDIFNIGLLTLIYSILLFIIPGILGFLDIGGGLINGNMRWVNNKAVIYSSTYIVIFLLSFYLFNFKKSTNITKWENKRVIFIVLLLIFTGIFVKIYRIVNGSYETYIYANIDSPIFIYQYLISLNIFFYFALTISFIHYYQLIYTNNDKINLFKIISWTQFALYLFLTIFTSGSKFYIAFIILIPLISRYYILKDIKTKFIFIILLCISLLFPVKNIFKDISIASNYLNIDVITNTNWNEKSILNYFFHSNDSLILFKIPEVVKDNKILDLYLDSTLGRINQLHVLSIVIDHTNGNYLKGKTFDVFFISLGIPTNIVNIFFDSNTDTNFPIKSGLSDNNLTGIGNTNIGDVYQNFGLIGVISYSFTLGLILKFFYLKFCNPRNSSSFFYYVFLTPIFLHSLEQSLASSVSHLFKLTIFIFIINHILNWKKTT